MCETGTFSSKQGSPLWGREDKLSFNSKHTITHQLLKDNWLQPDMYISANILKSWLAQKNKTRDSSN